MPEGTVQPLERRISSLLEEIAAASSIRDKIAYPSVRQALELAEKNSIESLRLMATLVNDVIIWGARQKNEYEVKIDSTKTLEETIRDWSSGTLNDCYQICDGIFSDYFSSELNSSLPAEIYLWIDDFVHGFKYKGSKKQDIPQVVFHQSTQYINSKHSDSLATKVDTLIELSNTPVLVGVQEVKPKPVPFPFDKMKNLYIVSFIPGGARNPALWPILMHEALHIIDKQWQLVSELEEFINSSEGFLPLDKEPSNTLKWTKEIAIDMLTLGSAGPMFAYSLAEYLDYLPYIANADYPSMDARLYILRKFLEDPRNHLQGSIDDSRQFFLRALIRKKIKEPSNRVNFDKLYDLIMRWMVNSKLLHFSSILENYHNSQTSNTAIRTMFNSDRISPQNIDLVPFADPVYSYEDMVRMLFIDKIPVAIHPTILMNVALSQMEAKELGYKELDVLVDLLIKSIEKWKIREKWSAAVEELRSSE
jgi:hypothetical protein